MKFRALIGWAVVGTWFLFATYVSITGGPNLKSKSNEPDSARLERIAASAKPAEGHTDGCCSKKEQAAAETAKPAAKPSCGSGEGKCEHH